MSNVSLLIGPYRSGKTEKLLSWLTESCASGKLLSASSHLVVPSSRYKTLVQERLNQTLLEGRVKGQKGLLGLGVDNFYSLCGKILKKAGVSYRLIPDSVRPAIVARAMIALKGRGELDNLLPLAEFKGTYGSILELIDEFQRAGLSPDDVLVRLNKSAATSSKHIELARVYKQYWMELDSIDFIDNRRLAFAAREHLSSIRGTQRLFGSVGVDGFDRFNRLQLDVLKGLSRHCQKLTICFDYIEDIENSQQRQEYIWKQASFEDLSSTFQDAQLDWASIDQVIEPNVSCIKAVDRYLEMEEIARSVKSALVEEKLSGSDILMVVPSMRKYRSAIESAFDDAGLPYFVDESVALSTVPVVQYVFSLLSIMEDDFARADVIKVLANQHFNTEQFPILSDSLNILDNLSLDSDLIGGVKQWIGLTLDQKLKEELTRFFSIVTPPQGIATLTDFVAWVEDLLSICLKAVEDADHVDPLKNWIEERACAEFRNCLGGLVQEDIVLNGGQSGVILNYQDFLRHLEHVVEQSNFRSSSIYKSPVTICSIDLAPNRKFKRVYLGGLVEGEFPRRAKARGFVSFDEINQWMSYGIGIDNPRLHPTFEYGLFQSLVKRAVESVHLSLPMWDMAGDEVLPSFFITSGELDVESIEMAPYIMSAKKPYSLKDFVSGALAMGADSESLKQFKHPEIVDLVDSISDQQSMLLSRLHRVLESNYNGCLKEQVSLGTLKVNMPEMWSASRLNEYGKCPFRYWVGQVLKLEVHEEPTLDLDSRILGQTYHKALELFYGKLIEAKQETLHSNPESTKTFYAVSVDEAICELESESRVKDNQFWHYLRREIEFRLGRFLDYELERENKAKESFVVNRVEAAFGMGDEGSAQPLTITDGTTSVQIRGKIDRVDVGLDRRGRVRVVDYKAGSGYISSSEALAGRNLQMPIYMMAVENCIDKGSSSVEGLYLSITSGKAIGKVDFDDPEKKEKVIQATKNYILEYVRSIKSGQFAVMPNGNNVCDSCQHRLVCRVNEMKKG